MMTQPFNTVNTLSLLPQLSVGTLLDAGDSLSAVELTDLLQTVLAETTSEGATRALIIAMMTCLSDPSKATHVVMNLIRFETKSLDDEVQ